MHALEAIQNTLDLIENRIGDELPIEKLAETAALSLFYYQRLFTRLVKKPVREYIKLRRLARACEALRCTDDRILDIALDHGFSSHELFSKAFKEIYGMTPTEYRDCDVRVYSFDKPDLLLGYTLIDLGVPLISDGLVLEMNRETLADPVRFMGVKRFVSISGVFPKGEVTGVDEPGEVWREFSEIKSAIPAIPDGRKIGVAYPGGAPEGCFPYFVGVEVEPDANAASFDTWTLPAAEYLICRFEAENFEELVTAALTKAIKYMHLWQQKNGLRLEGFGAEIYYSEHDNNEPDVCFMEMWSLWLV